MLDIFWGLLIIAIGLFAGQSILQGDFSPLSFIFDGLGFFWLGRGIFGLNKKKQQQTRPGETPGKSA